jgi:tetratricopeptide (TPR) repeat protein
MKENKFLQSRIPFCQRIILVLLGICLFFVFLESGLRLGGFILSSLQEHHNLQSIKQKGAYRILCLGESTTQNQYPQFLELALNQRNIGVRFSVVDKGFSGTTTSIILAQVESYLAEYHPDMVVAMMGINDLGGEHIPYEAPTTAKGMLFIRSFKTYKLGRLLWLHILTKAKEAGFYKPNTDRHSHKEACTYLPGMSLKESLAESIPPEDTSKKVAEFIPQNDSAYVNAGWFYKGQREFPKAEEAFRKAVELNPQNDNAYFGLGRLYQEQGKFSQAEEAFKKAAELAPGNNNTDALLGWLYQEQGKFSQAEEAFNQAIALNPRDISTYAGLWRLYQEQGKFSQAEEALKKAVEFYPQNDNAYANLGWFYEGRFKFSQAEEAFKRVAELNPQNYNAYFGLGRVYRQRGEFSKAEEAFRRAVELNPQNDNVYIGLGLLYQDQGKFPQAQDAFKKAAELNPKNDKAYGAISALYRKIGKPELAEEYAKKANRLRLEYYSPLTVNNYHKLKNSLDKKGIRLICVQYPLRSIRQLKKIFEKDNNIIFVDNERVFKEAVKKASYREYFNDTFGGDFGHCTNKGNKLLAENIAKVILREVFNQ